MKNVFLVLFLLSGFLIAGLQAQQCLPGPSCHPGCCKVSAEKEKNAAASALIMPASFDILAAYPTSNSVGQVGAKCTPADVAACKPACTASSAPQCQSATSVAFQPSGAPQCKPATSVAYQPSNAPTCQPAACKTVPSSASVTPQSQTPKPMKG